MPKNHFQDSPEKRELRRRDRRLLQRFVTEIGRKLDYCGMPSVEYLDVDCWKQMIRRVTALEYASEVVQEMKIERDRRGYGFPISVQEADVLDFLQETNQSAFDLYNLDFYGGFLYVRKTGGSKCVDAFRQLFRRQAGLRRPFALITTFNVREAGAKEYLEFLDVVERELHQIDNCHENIDAHKAAQADRMQLCFPAFCWQQAQANGFNQVLHESFLYQSTAQMLHFHQWFTTAEGALPKASYRNVLIELANRPLVQMDGQIPNVRRRYPQISL